MPILDENTDFIDPTTVSIWPTAMKYGLMMGLAGVVFKLASFMVDLGDWTIQSVIGVLSLIISILILRAAIQYFRDEELGGYISLGKVISLGVPIILISTMMSVIFQYVYINFVDPSIIDATVEASMATIESMGVSVPEEKLEEMETGIRDGMQLQSLLLSGLGVGAIGGLIISAIAGAIMKKEPPMIA